jgi:Tfp pilus assembly protein PilF
LQGRAFHRGSTIGRYVLATLFFLAGIFSIEVNTRAAGEAGEYYSRGTGYLREGKLDEAIGALTEAIHREPNYSEAYHNRALAYYEKKRYDEAEADFTKAAELDPNDEKVNNNLGIFLFQRGRDEEALVYMNRALALSDKRRPCHVDVCKNVAVIYTKKGLYQEAAAACDRAAHTLPALDPTPLDQREYEQSVDGQAMTLKFYGH